MKSWTQKNIRRWVYSGAMDPMALVRDVIMNGRREHPLWGDAPPFPWVKARTLEDMVARIFQDEFRRVLRAVFGSTGGLPDLAELVRKPKRRVA